MTIYLIQKAWRGCLDTPQLSFDKKEAEDTFKKELEDFNEGNDSIELYQISFIEGTGEDLKIELLDSR